MRVTKTYKVFRSRQVLQTFSAQRAASPSSCEKSLRGTVDMCYWQGQIVVKQIVKLLIVVIILKNFNKRSLYFLLDKRSFLRIMQH
jgi:hypothetical protein